MYVTTLLLGESTNQPQPQLLAFFEFCAHPLYSTTRCRSAILLVDALVQSLSLTCIDAGDHRATIFPAGEVPSLPLSASPHDVGCCPRALSPLPVRPRDPTKLNKWLQGLSVSEIRKEENRRMVWGAMQAFTAYLTAESEFSRGFLPLFTTEPFNVSFLALSGKANNAHALSTPNPVFSHVPLRGTNI
jgi:hypothetical protein